MKAAASLILLLTGAVANAQYVWPKDGYNDSEPGLYVEDPFIVQYRKEFFAVFRGDFARFRRALTEIERMVEQNPSDARALVWRGNGRMVEAGLAMLQNREEEAKNLLGQSHRDMDQAVRLTPDDPNIYMMRAATLLLIHQRFPREWTTRSLYDRLRDDAVKFIAYIGPDRMSRVSIHLRGEAYACLAIASEGLGLRSAARKAWQTLTEINRGTEYETKALAELARMEGGGASRSSSLLRL
jgi:hypothetical protein